MMNQIISRGILGLGQQSNAYYLDQIQKRYEERNEMFATCPLLMYQIDFQEINLFLPNQFSILIPRIKHYLDQVSKLGITKLLVPNITLHETLDQITFELEICHPVLLTIQYLKENNIKKVFLFGTNYTMNSDYIKQRFSEKEILVESPTEADQEWIDRFRKSVYAREVTLIQVYFYQEMLKKYGGTLPVVIACTELSIYALKNVSFCIDMADLQIEKFLK
ncbi:aspartate/glutamate racemase family protein [Chryseobacterium sp. SNU WT5]|uniref:aspartate/glutamate racemase family protein n=1 Tax=Chryseobacterium sp. SNU WT5 TaxID=2594269 RepID=UPI00117C914C|nr:aspartate/glutamate racemase family protein [Chryseobacterium sp. SNU WT5]QDP85326.1 aspartate/glutamate racemase family protein [Chryseobacterium sp. SNU WT5]